VLQHLGKRGAALLLQDDPRMRALHRTPNQAGSALVSAPPARLFWQAAYPRAFRDRVEPSASAGGTPDLFVYAIMRKESSFQPHRRN
jgi:soluble lytic murein transglycosylase-like protein